MGTNYVRLALEQAPNPEGGTNALSSVTFDVPSTELTLNPNPTLWTRDDEMRGTSGPPTHLGAASYMPEANIPVAAYPGILGLFLALVWGPPTTTQGVAGPTVVDPDSVEIPVDAYRHVFTRKTGDPPQTADIKHSNLADGLFYHASGAGVDSLAFAKENGAWKLTAAMKALYWAIIPDPSITPAYETVKPFLDGMMTLSWLSGGATIDDFDLTINAGVEQKDSHTVASEFPDLLQFSSNFQTITGKVDKSKFDIDDWNALINGTSFSAVAKWVHDTAIGATSYKPTLWIAMPACQYTEATPEASKNSIRHPASYNWAAQIADGGTTYATITLVNGVASYATYA